MNMPENAKSVVEKVRQGPFPIHIVQLAQDEGIKVFGDDGYGTGKSGHIELTSDDEVHIVVNITHPAERQRFTIAHELGHYLMDMDYLRQHRVIDRDGQGRDPTYRSRESKANRFAAEILMPEEAFINQWCSLNGLNDVADYFGVSRQAAEYRAVNLGLVKVV